MRHRFFAPACAAVVACLVACAQPEPARVSPAASAASHGPPGVPRDIDRLSPLPDPLPEVVAAVDGEPVPLRLVLPAVRQALAKAGAAGDPRVAYRMVTEQYVTRHLLRREGVTRGLEVSDEAVAGAEAQERLRLPAAGAWQEFLEEQGMTEEEYRGELRARLTVLALLSSLGAGEPITDAAAKAHHDRHPNEFLGSFEQVREQVKVHLGESRRGELVDALIARLRSEAHIENFLVAAPPAAQPEAPGALPEASPNPR